jgi:hypothetical protein
MMRMAFTVRARGSLEVEAVRCPLEHEARAALEALDCGRPAVARTLAEARRELASHAVLLTTETAPELAILGPLACASLGLQDTRVELWCSSEPGLARYVPVASPEERVAMVVILRDAVLEELGTDAMLALLTHELGHHLAHGTETTCVPAEHPPSRATAAFCANAARIACEITADRLALVGCRDLDAHLRLDTARTSAPLDRVAASARVRTLLAESFEVVEQVGREERCVALETKLHERSLRIWAAARFVESDGYRELTGLGPGGVSLHALDAAIAQRVRGPAPLTDRVKRPRKVEPSVSSTRLAADVAWLATVATVDAVEHHLEGAEREVRALANDALDSARPAAEIVAGRIAELLRKQRD